MAAGTSPWPMYPRYCFAYWWQRAGALIGAGGLVYTVRAVYDAPPCALPEELFLLAALWGVLPPLWWWVEFFYIFPRHHTAEKFELLKHGAQASLAIWAPIAVALAAYSSSDYFKPPEPSQACVYVKH